MTSTSSDELDLDAVDGPQRERDESSVSGEGVEEEVGEEGCHALGGEDAGLTRAGSCWSVEGGDRGHAAYGSGGGRGAEGGGGESERERDSCLSSHSLLRTESKEVDSLRHLQEEGARLGVNLDELRGLEEMWLEHEAGAGAGQEGGEEGVGVAAEPSERKEALQAGIKSSVNVLSKKTLRLPLDKLKAGWSVLNSAPQPSPRRTVGDRDSSLDSAAACSSSPRPHAESPRAVSVAAIKKLIVNRGLQVCC